MDNNKKFELSDEALDEVAGGRDGFNGETKSFLMCKSYTCGNCGGHDFSITSFDGQYYSGNCKVCGTYHSHICTVNDVDFTDISWYHE